MKQKKYWIIYPIASAIAIAVALLACYYEVCNYGGETTLLMHFLSDGFFTSAVLYLGCGALVFIAEAGNFYGLQYLFYTVVRQFSFRKKRYESKKDYYDYCAEKKAALKERGKSAIKWALIFVGAGCLVLSVIFAVVFYQLAGPQIDLALNIGA